MLLGATFTPHSPLVFLHQPLVLVVAFCVGDAQGRIWKSV